MRYLICPIVAFVIVVSAASLHANDQEDVYTTSLIALIASPDRYDGKIVRVIGFPNIEFEGDALYLHKEDYNKSLTKNAVAVSISDKGRLRRFNQKYVIIEGVFEKIDEVKMACVWSSYLTNVRSIRSWGWGGLQDEWKEKQ